ncbi:MAG: hypothetical protein ACR2JB_11495 [Bryobacteraceae bacterium]
MFGHTHSAYTHLDGKRLSGYIIDVLKIIRAARLKGKRRIDVISGRFVDGSDSKPPVPFTLHTHDSHLTDPVNLRAIFAALQTKLNDGNASITLVYRSGKEENSRIPTQHSP